MICRVVIFLQDASYLVNPLDDRSYAGSYVNLRELNDREVIDYDDGTYIITYDLVERFLLTFILHNFRSKKMAGKYTHRSIYL